MAQAKNSLVKTFSRRLDSATPMINLAVLLIALVSCVILTTTTILPDSESIDTLEKRLSEKKAQVEAERKQALLLKESFKALSDPQYVADFAVERYRYAWRTPQGNVSRR